MPRAIARLVVLLACVGLAASRLGLLAHELVGHGGATLAVGGRVTDVRLFWFAGGWIRYELDAPTVAGLLVVALGGVAVEIVLGTILWLAASRATLGVRILRGIGATLWVHAGWYLATGAWHGYGDGTLLYRELGDARWPFAIGVGLVACLAAFAGARWVAAAIAATMPGSRAARIGGTLAAVIVAGAINVGLDLAELRVRRDATYHETMAPERDRLIAREYQEWAIDQARRGATISEIEREAKARALDEAHRTFPFAWLLAIGLAGAVVAGAIRSRAAPDTPIPSRLLQVAIATAALAIGAVIAIGALLTR